MALGNMFKDYPSSVESVPNLRPEQLSLQNQVIGNAGNLLNQTSQNQFNFDPIAQKQTADFYTHTVPSLANRFTGAQGSSAFQGALGAAGAGLKRDLAAMGAEYGLRNQQQQQGHLSNLLSAGLSPSYEHFYTPPQEGPGKQILGTAANLAGQFGSAYINARGAQGVTQALGGIGGGAATGALAAGAPFLPIMGGLAGAAVLAGAGYGLYRLIKRGQSKSAEAKQLRNNLNRLDAYQRSNPTEFPANFPKRLRGESLDKWSKRIDGYTQSQQFIDRLKGQPPVTQPEGQ